MALPFMTVFSYVKLYWKLFVVGALLLFITYLFNSIYSLKEELHLKNSQIVKLTDERDDLIVINERNTQTIKNLQRDSQKKNDLIIDINQINSNEVLKIKKILQDMKTQNPFGTSVKDCNCSIKILPTKGDFVHETISTIGKF